MKNKALIISLAVTAVVGSLFAFLASNMFFDDILNIAVITRTLGILVSLPALMVAAFFVLVLLHLLRVYKHPDCQKRTTKVHAIIAIALGSVGALATILAGVLVYKNFFSPNPFPGYLVIFLLLNLAIAGCSVFYLLCSKKMKEDEGKMKINFLYVLKTVGWFLFISLMLYRLGTFLASPAFIYWRGFGKTFLFYLWLLVPAYLGVVAVLNMLKIIDNKKMMLLAIIGLSQAMPMERIAAKPVELPIHFLAYTGVGIALIVVAKKQKAE